MKVTNQYTENDKLITEMETDSGQIVKIEQPVTVELSGSTLPENPILKLQQENADLKAQLASTNADLASLMETVYGI